MSTLTLHKSQSPLLPILILVTLLGFGWVLIGRNEPVTDEINDAMDTGITIPVAVNGCNNFKLKDFKTPGKWRMQFRKRGFTVERVRTLLQQGTKQMIIDNKGKTMLKVTDPVSGDFIIIDPLTCQIWQIAPSTFLN